MFPTPRQFVTAVCVLITSFHLLAAVCNRERWFGPTRCLYQCHCAGDVPCDKTNGACPQGCQSGWFGPACQYEMTSYSFSSLPPGDDGAWLLDHSDDTCNNGTAHTVNLNLTTPRPLTWVRLVVSQPGRLDQLHLSYQDSSEGGLTPCHHASRAKVDERTLDILCPTQTAVDSVTVSGAGVHELCSLYISAGRNVALKQVTRQSSVFDSWGPEKAVDGNPGNPGWGPNQFRRVCSHTKSSEPEGWWTVTFSRAVNINSFVIYNRRRDQPVDIDHGCCEHRLRGFTLRAFQDGDSAAVYTYTDTAASAKPVYEVVPTHTIDEPVNSVRITNRDSSDTLTLCEVLVLGETVCPAGKFGLNCDRQCNCADTQELCFVSTGGCTSGCAPGFTGEDCHTACPGKTYGPDCVGTCSDHCGSSQICSADNGHCVDGCNPGYAPPLCDDECPKTTFGQDCRENCSSSCVDSDCDHVNGTCKRCPPGYIGDYCNQECPIYTFGDGCSETCSAFCVDRICLHTTGACGNCTEGREGHFCEIECPKTTFGQDCQKKCSSSCVDSDCDHVNGTCKQCPLGYIGDYCNQALQQSEESDGAGVIIWAITATVVAAAALAAVAAIIGVLMCRRNRKRSDLFRTTDSYGDVKLGRHPDEQNPTPGQPHVGGDIRLDQLYESIGTDSHRGDATDNRRIAPQQGMSAIKRANHDYHSTETDQNYVNLYSSGFDHYDKPVELMTEGTAYETPASLAVKPSDRH